ncbi:MAG: MFS transporter [Candidatus Methanomethylicaceae archaeon]|nr:MFS transporter [Candidatus Verstraetearchaeota archaeon]
MNINILTLLITCLFLSLLMGISYPLISEYIYAITNSSIFVGLIFSIKSILGMLFVILGGFLADNIGRKKPIYIGTILMGFSFIIYAISNNILEFIIASFFESFSLFYFPAFNAMIMDSTEKDKLMKIFTISLIFDHLPYSITSILGGFIRDNYGILGLRICFLISGIFIIIIGIIRWKLLLETLIEIKKINFKMIIKPYIEIFNDFKKLNPLIIRIIILRSFILLNAFSIFYSFSLIYAVRYAEILSFTEWGMILAISSFSYLIAIILVKITKISYYPIIIFFEAISILLFFIEEKISILISLILINILGALTYAIERTILAKTIEQQMRGRAETFMNLSFYIGSFIGSILGGYFYTIYPPLILIIPFIMLILGSIIATIIFRKIQ